MSLFRCLMSLALVSIFLAGLGCGAIQPPVTPAKNPELTGPQIVSLLTAREHQVVAVFPGSSASIHSGGSGFGGNLVQVYDTRSRLAENQLIEDEFNKRLLQQDPMLLAPLLRLRDPDAALTALYIYDKAMGHIFRPSNEPQSIRQEDFPAVFDLIRETAMKHRDLRVRLEAGRILAFRKAYTVDDMAVWLQDHSQEVRLFGAFYCMQLPPGDLIVRADGLRVNRPDVAADYVTLLIAHLDDPNIHVAGRVESDIEGTIAGMIQPKTLQEIGGPEIRDATASWSHMGWSDRVLGKEKMQDWWDDGGRDAFLQAARQAEHERIRRAELSSTTD